MRHGLPSGDSRAIYTDSAVRIILRPELTTHNAPPIQKLRKSLFAINTVQQKENSIDSDRDHQQHSLAGSQEVEQTLHRDQVTVE